MKKTIITFAFLFYAFFSNAQSPYLDWVKSIDVYSLGRFFKSTTDPSGNVYITGAFYQTSDFDPGIGVFNQTANGTWGDIFILKLDPSGNFIWAKRIGGELYDDGNAIVVDASGNVYVTGGFVGKVDFNPNAGKYYLESHGVDDQDIFVLKLDANGNLVWAKNMGGFASEVGMSITLDASGNVYTTGSFATTVDFDPGLHDFNLTAAGDEDVFISKLDRDGNFVWAKKMGGTNYDVGTVIKMDEEGNIYTLGGFLGTSDFNPGIGTYNLTSLGTQMNTFISKLNASGDFVWAKSLGTIHGSSLALDGNNNIYVSGSFANTADFDPDTFVYNLTSIGETDMFFQKLDSSGKFKWAINIGGSHIDIVQSMVLDASAGIYSTGFFSNTVDFDPDTGKYNLTSVAGSDVFILKIDSSGKFNWAKDLDGNSTEYGHSISLDWYGNIYTVGFFDGTTDFDPNQGAYYLTSPFRSMFVHKMSRWPSGIKAKTNSSKLDIYPNPASNIFNIDIPNPTNNSRIEIYNAIGVLVYSQKSLNGINKIDFKNQPNGLYIVNFIDEENNISEGRIVKTE